MKKLEIMEKVNNDWKEHQAKQRSVTDFMFDTMWSEIFKSIDAISQEIELITDNGKKPFICIDLEDFNHLKENE